METKVNYTVVGSFVVLLTLAIFFISLWLTVGLNKPAYKTYLVYMNESVAGLSEQAPVKYNGINVGYVSSMKLNPKNPGEVILKLKIVSGTPITTGTEATLMQQGITGIAYIGLRNGIGKEPLKVLAGQPYPVIKSTSSLLLRLDKALQGFTKNLNSLTDNFNALLDKQNLLSIKNTLKNLQDITKTVADNDQEISSSMKSLSQVLQDTSIAAKRLPSVLNNISSTALAIQSTAKKTRTAVQNFSDQIMPQTYSVLQKGNNIANSLETFSESLAENPNILIRGSRPGKLGPGEK